MINFINDILQIKGISENEKCSLICKIIFYFDHFFPYENFINNVDISDIYEIILNDDNNLCWSDPFYDNSDDDSDDVSDVVSNSN